MTAPTAWPHVPEAATVEPTFSAWVKAGVRPHRAGSMPRYFFDIEDNDKKDVDHTGIEIDALADVRNQAIATLPQMAIEELPDGPQHIFRVRVRDENGADVFTASLELKSEWLNGTAGE